MDEVVGDGQFFGSSWESDPTVAIINGSLKLQNMSVEADVLLGLPVYRVTGNLPDNLETRTETPILSKLPFS